MNKKDTRYKSKSDYSLLRKKHKLTSEGSIYENDLMTISKMDELFSDQVPIYSDGNFKFSVRAGSNSQRKHYRGNWECPDNLSDGNCEWTLENIETLPDVQTTETRVKLNPDYSSISDFAYYGSAVELFQASVNDILMNFPGELYFSNKSTDIDGEKYYLVENDYGIDVYSLSLPDENSVNRLRYFYTSAYTYEVIYKDKIVKLSECAESGSAWVSELYEITCEEQNSEEGALLADVYIDGGNIHLYVRYINGGTLLYYKDDGDESLIGTRIRPSSDIYNAYFETLDPFESVLLTRDSNPIYMATFKTFTETDKGTTYSYKKYAWPCTNGFNPDTNGVAFEAYISDMLKLCQYYDEHNTDNIWRKMTHESIKNLDWTFIRSADDSQDVYDSIDTTRISAICRLYGRQYDDLKMYIDAIKCANNVSYNGKSNAADYVLSDILENKGIDAINLNITNDNTIETTKLYPGSLKHYTSSDANVEFLRRLILNSKYLSSVKGTREGVDCIMALLGFAPDEYELNEYVIVASGRTDYQHFAGKSSDVITYPLYEDIAYINSYRDSVYALGDNDSDDEMSLRGLPLTKVTVDVDGEDVSYVIPWFSKDMTYDGDLYFQQYGGWMKSPKKTVNLTIAPNVKQISSSNLLQLFGETIPALKFARDINEMLEFSSANISEGDICYVSDVSDIINVYTPKDSSEIYAIQNNKYSNYFVLENKDFSTWAGYYSGTSIFDVYGWKNILTEEFDNDNNTLTENGKKVIYYEMIKDNTIGNNPHGGDGYYDCGESYIEAMTKPFKWASQVEDFSWFSDEDSKYFEDYGFDAVKYKDNQKCWYFTDEANFKTIYTKLHDGDEYEEMEPVAIGKECDSAITEMESFNPEGGETYGEAAANSIINIKNIELTFKPKAFKDETRKYIEQNIMPYITMMIPSTTIFSYKFEDDEDEVILLTPQVSYYINGVSGKTVEFDAIIDDETEAHVQIESKPINCVINLTVTGDAEYFKIVRDETGKGFNILPLSDNESDTDRVAGIVGTIETVEDENYDGTATTDVDIKIIQHGNGSESGTPDPSTVSLLLASGGSNKTVPADNTSESLVLAVTYDTDKWMVSASTNSTLSYDGQSGIIITGYGNTDEITISYDKNTTNNSIDHEAVAELMDTKSLPGTKMIIVTQEPAVAENYIKLYSGSTDSTNITVPSTFTEGNLTLSTNTTDWKILASNSSYCMVDPSTGSSGTTKITYICDKNTAYTQYTIILSAISTTDNIYSTFRVTQNAEASKNFSITSGDSSSKTLNIAYDTTTFDLNVNSDTYWKLDAYGENVTAATMSGYLTGTTTIYCEENGNTASTKEYIISGATSDGSASDKITIVQAKAPCTLSLKHESGKSTLSVDSSSQRISGFTVVSNTSWKLSFPSAYGKLTQTSGTGTVSGSIGLDLYESKSSTDETYYITGTTNDGSVTVTYPITQKAKSEKTVNVSVNYYVEYPGGVSPSGSYDIEIWDGTDNEKVGTITSSNYGTGSHSETVSKTLVLSSKHYYYIDFSVPYTVEKEGTGNDHSQQYTGNDLSFTGIGFTIQQN